MVVDAPSAVATSNRLGLTSTATKVAPAAAEAKVMKLPMPPTPRTTTTSSATSRPRREAWTAIDIGWARAARSGEIEGVARVMQHDAGTATRSAMAPWAWSPTVQ